MSCVAIVCRADIPDLRRQLRDGLRSFRRHIDELRGDRVGVSLGVELLQVLSERLEIARRTARDDGVSR